MLICLYFGYNLIGILQARYLVFYFVAIFCKTKHLLHLVFKIYVHGFYVLVSVIHRTKNCYVFQRLNSLHQIGKLARFDLGFYFKECFSFGQT